MNDLVSGIETPTLSVCVIAYNQEKYLEQCLQSIVDQKTDFYFEVIVGDDCSTDGTNTIIRNFEKKYPRVVKGIYQETNTGGTKSYLDVHAAARGTYVAHIDGDDYALPSKLQQQVDIFRNFPNVSMVVHGTLILDVARGNFLEPVRRFYSNRLENMFFLLANLPYFAHSSKMYKRCLDEDFFYNGTDIIDCQFHIFHASKGDIYMIPEELTVYRMNIGLSTTQGTNIESVVSQRTNELRHEAIDSARKFNVSEDMILKSHAQSELMNAISLLRSRSYDEYRLSISRSVKFRKMGILQNSLFILRDLPVLSRLVWISVRWIVFKIKFFRQYRAVR